MLKHIGMTSQNYVKSELSPKSRPVKKSQLRKYEKSTAMHGKKSRQNYFEENWGFLCKCEICEDDEEDENQEIVQKFEELKVKAQEMQEIADESATLQGESNQSWLISKLLITLIFTKD